MKQTYYSETSAEDAARNRAKFFKIKQGKNFSDYFLVCSLGLLLVSDLVFKIFMWGP